MGTGKLLGKPTNCGGMTCYGLASPSRLVCPTLVRRLDVRDWGCPNPRGYRHAQKSKFGYFLREKITYVLRNSVAFPFSTFVFFFGQ